MKKISLVEYGNPRPIIGETANQLGISPNKLVEMIFNTGERVKDLLNFSKNPIVIHDDSIRAIDFAGILQVGPSLEIEIAPKFLGIDSDNDRWREDFFYLSTLSKYGTLLNSDRLLARTSERADLHTLIARAFVEIYWENHRRSLRTYTKVTYIDFAIDGEVEPESLVFPSSEGFQQTKVLFDRNNQYNAVIIAAAKQLLPNLKEPGISSQLLRIIQNLAPQKNIVMRNIMKLKLPGRLSRWQSLYNLSIDIIRGYGLIFERGRLLAPGYVINTWRVWEDFLSVAINRGFGNDNVKRQRSFDLGTRERIPKNKSKLTVKVKPDLVITYNDSAIPKRFVFDAKYKGHIERGIKRITEQDLYESLAFARAADCKTVLLAYPASPIEGLALGDVNVFEKIVVDNVVIIGIEVESKGISSKGGMIFFSDQLALNCINIIDEWT